MNNIIERTWKRKEFVNIDNLSGYLFQDENNGHTFQIRCEDESGITSFTGSVSATFLRPDNTDVLITGSIYNGVAYVTLTADCYNVSGKFGITIFNTADSQKTAIYAGIGTISRTSSGNAPASAGQTVEDLIARIDAAIASIPQDYSALSKSVPAKNPELRNGSTGNPGNANAVTTKYILRIDKDSDDVLVEYIGSINAASYDFGYSIFKGVTDSMTSSEARTNASSFIDRPTDKTTTSKYAVFKISEFGDYTHIAFVLWASDESGNRIPIRIANDQNNVRVTFRHAMSMGHEAINSRQVQTDVQNAGLKSNILKLVHFSDLHADTAALGRIRETAQFVAPDADMICTGDIVANTYTQISGWWFPEILTCVGNHDSASYSSESGYNWTALSMADRNAYYIEPFIANWGSVSHPAGTSYYYKDYPNQNVRLIVLDIMLYNDNGSEATAQTSWLSSVLASAWSSGLHVLIAVHAPHGGSLPVVCSFTRHGQTVMPVHTDCNTPQVVIDTVANAINSGLHFIGYICGHTHQDTIWDATGDKSQLMYCVTCAAVTQSAQWVDSDQYRTTEQDAMNVIAIDTSKSLIKIVRAGGANTDEYLQDRDSIVINYSTGTILSGDTSGIQNISVGTVTTVNPDQNAAVSVREDSSGGVILDFSIPRGMTGSAEDVYGSSIPVSESVSTTVTEKLNALESGLNTARSMEIPAVAASVNALKVLVIDCGTVSSLPVTVSNAAITENHVVINSEIGTPLHVASDLTVTTSNGSVTVTGTLNGNTLLKLYLAKA